MNGNLVAISTVVSFVLFPLILVALFKRGRKYTKYLWLAIAVLGTVKLVLDLYIGADGTQLLLNLVLVVFALMNTYSYFKGGRRV